MGNVLHQLHLAVARRHVAAAMATVAKQRDLIARLESGGHDASEAQGLLAVFEETLAVMAEHLDLLMRTDRDPDS